LILPSPQKENTTQWIQTQLCLLKNLFFCLFFLKKKKEKKKKTLTNNLKHKILLRTQNTFFFFFFFIFSSIFTSRALHLFGFELLKTSKQSSKLYKKNMLSNVDHTIKHLLKKSFHLYITQEHLFFF
jgi:hypothetical protein